MYRFYFAAFAAMIFSTPVWGTTAELARKASEFIAHWEHPALAQGKVDYVNGHFPGADPLASARACEARPGCREGAVIGFGYSLAGHSEADVLRDLTPIIGRERAAKMLRCVGLTGMAAYNACHDSLDLRLTRDEAFSLLEDTRVLRDIRAVRAKAADEGVALSPEQKIALVSLHYTSPKLVLRAPKLWNALSDGDLAAAADEVAFNSGTRHVPGLAPRREAEARLLLTEDGGQPLLVGL